MACKATLEPVTEPLEADPELFNEVVQNARVPVLVASGLLGVGLAVWQLQRWRVLLPICVGRRLWSKLTQSVIRRWRRRFNVQGIPMFIVFNKGQIAAQQAGVVTHQQLENWLRSALEHSPA